MSRLKDIEEKYPLTFECKTDCRDTWPKRWLAAKEHFFGLITMFRLAANIQTENPTTVLTIVIDMLYKVSQAQGKITDVTMHPDIAKKILAIRDELVKQDYQEAFHILYSIASPEFDKIEPWAELEKIVGDNNIKVKGAEVIVETMNKSIKALLLRSLARYRMMLIKNGKQ